MNSMHRRIWIAGALSLLTGFAAVAQETAPKVDSLVAAPAPPAPLAEDETMPPAPPAKPRSARHGADSDRDRGADSDRDHGADSDRDRGAGIIIRQKGEKDSKITVEIHGGQVRINGKPVDSFEDKNISVRPFGPADAATIDLSGMDELRVSPFRMQAWDQKEMQRVQHDLQRQQKEIERQMKTANGQRELALADMNRQLKRSVANDAFLGVGSKHADAGGALVVSVSETSPASKAGLKKGDVIRKVDDTDIDGPEALFSAIHVHKPGEKVQLVYLRDGKEKKTTAVLEKSRESPPGYNPDMDYHFNFRLPEPPMPPGSYGEPYGDTDDESAPKIGLKARDAEDGRGVDIVEVTGGSPAEKAGLKKGDNITRFNGGEVNSAEELADRVHDARDKAAVPFTVKRDGKTQDLELHVPRKLKTAEL